MTKQQAEAKAREVVFEWGDKALSSLEPDDIPPLERKIAAALLAAERRGAEAMREARAGGLEKAAEIARYHRDKFGRRLPGPWMAACEDIITSCLATAGRIRRGEYEDPVSAVQAALPLPEGEGGSGGVVRRGTISDLVSERTSRAREPEGGKDDE